MRVGAWTLYRPDGRKEAVGALDGGERHGRWTEWQEDGSVAEGLYQAGQREGAWKIATAGGLAIAQGTYKQDRQHGEWIYFDAAGRPVSRADFREGNRMSLVSIADASRF